MNPRSDGRELYGVPAVVYDGTNAEAILEAMHFEEGDAVVVIDAEKSILLRASQIDMMRESAAASFESFRRDHFWPHTATPRSKPPVPHQGLGLIRKLLEEGET